MSKDIILSNEQILIQKSNANIIKVNAFAGTGKTTTLLYRALENPKQKILYVCYNKTIQLEAQNLFPKNVNCVTSHSLGYRYEGYKYRHKLNSFINHLNIIEELKLQKSKNPSAFASILMSTVENFCSSEDLEINANHLPYDELSLLGVVNKNNINEKIDVINGLIKRADYLWYQMCNTDNTKLSMTHDGYLKLFQLNIKKLPFDCIMLDEAQDLTPCTFSIFDKQSETQKIIVGDTHQSIYQYRGAINAMNKYNTAQEYYLTNSFRFGSEIADVANVLLLMMGVDKKITGLGKSQVFQDSIRKFNNPVPVSKNNFGKGFGISNLLNKEKVDKLTFISRNNHTLLTYAFDELVKKEKAIYFEGGFNNYNIGQLLDVYKVYKGKETSNPLLSGFKDFKELLSTAQETENTSLVTSCMLVEKYHKVLPELLDKVKRNSVQSWRDAEILFTNTHKAKGKEYDNVVLLEDFDGSPLNPYLLQKLNSIEKNANPTSNNVQKEIVGKTLDKVNDKFKEDANIAYVAITRAKNKLFLPKNYLDTVNLSIMLMKKGINNETLTELKKYSYNVSDDFKVLLERNKLENMFMSIDKNIEKKKNKI